MGQHGNSRVYSASSDLRERLPATEQDRGGQVPQEGQAERRVGVILVP